MYPGRFVTGLMLTVGAGDPSCNLPNSMGEEWPPSRVPNMLKAITDVVALHALLMIGSIGSD